MMKSGGGGASSVSAIEETNAALGPSLLTHAISLGSGRSALVARWRHRDAEVDVVSSDTVRITMSLEDGQRIHDRTGGRTRTGVRAGSMAVFPTHTRTCFSIEGQCDVVQVFLPDIFVGQVAERPLEGRALIDSHDSGLQAAVMQLLVDAQRSEPDDQLLLEADCHRLAFQLVCHADQAASRRRDHFQGGLAPVTLRRLDGLIDEALDAPGARPPTLAALASVAELSVSHFIRAFRQEVGVTPHRHVLQRRIERAFTLLKRPVQSVGDVAEETGFASPAHFVATFRRIMGVTPGLVRAALLG